MKSEQPSPLVASLMVTADLYTTLSELPRLEKLHVMQFLVAELAKEEAEPTLQPGAAYSLWSPLKSYQSADQPAQLPSLKQLAALPLTERHQVLAASVAATAQDFLTDPDLTEFANLDLDDWDADHD